MEVQVKGKQKKKTPTGCNLPFSKPTWASVHFEAPIKFDWDAKSDYGFVKIDTKLSYHDGEGLLGVGFWRGTTLRLG